MGSPAKKITTDATGRQTQWDSKGEGTPVGSPANPSHSFLPNNTSGSPNSAIGLTPAEAYKQEQAAIQEEDSKTRRMMIAAAQEAYWNPPQDEQTNSEKNSYVGPTYEQYAQRAKQGNIVSPNKKLNIQLTTSETGPNGTKQGYVVVNPDGSQRPVTQDDWNSAEGQELWNKIMGGGGGGGGGGGKGSGGKGSGGKGSGGKGSGGKGGGGKKSNNAFAGIPTLSQGGKSPSGGCGGGGDGDPLSPQFLSPLKNANANPGPQQPNNSSGGGGGGWNNGGGMGGGQGGGSPSDGGSQMPGALIGFLKKKAEGLV